MGMWHEQEELGYADADDCADDLREEGVARLGEGGFEGGEEEDCCCAL